MTSQEHRGSQAQGIMGEATGMAGERTVATHLTLDTEDNPPWLVAIVLESRFSELVMTVPSKDRQI